MPLLRSPIRPFVFITVTMVVVSGLFTCSKNSLLNPFPYVPVIKFDGYFVDGSQFSWPGNKSYQNRCYLSGDTMMMYFFSEDYQQNPWVGDQLRLEVFYVDSGGYVTTHGALFHLARYSTGPTNLTYEVVPADTELKTYSLSMKAEKFSFAGGARIQLTNIGVTPRAIGAGTLPCGIAKGTITGNVE
jgi:hypothetical protein